MFHDSNTTLVKVKLDTLAIALALLVNSNTTLVKVKYQDPAQPPTSKTEFKYNSC